MPEIQGVLRTSSRGKTGARSNAPTRPKFRACGVLEQAGAARRVRNNARISGRVTHLIKRQNWSAE